MNFAAFLSYVFLTAFTPGPNNIMSMANASKYGFKKAFPFNVGVFVGFVIVMFCCATFTTVLYEYIPSIEPIMLAIGAAYILYLAYTICKDKPHDDKKSAMKTNTFFSGMVLQLVNVKVILYGITAISSFIFPYYKDAISICIAVVFLALVGFTGTCCWSLFGAVFERFFNKHGKGLNLIMALLLVYCAIVMALGIFK